jgi:hypothetical protein
VAVEAKMVAAAVLNQLILLPLCPFPAARYGRHLLSKKLIWQQNNPHFTFSSLHNKVKTHIIE